MAEFGVKRIVFSSSATVYGNVTPDQMPITEPRPTSATNPYGRTKLMIEEILQDLFVADKAWNIISLRYFNPVGAHASGRIGEDPKGVPNNLMPFIAQVAVGRRPHVAVYGSDYPTPDGTGARHMRRAARWPTSLPHGAADSERTRAGKRRARAPWRGTATGVRDYVHVVDLAQAHVAATKRLQDNEGLETFNVGTGRGYSVLEMIRAMSKACGKELPYQVRHQGKVRAAGGPMAVALTARAAACGRRGAAFAQLAPRRTGDVASMYADCSLAEAKVRAYPCPRRGAPRHQLMRGTSAKAAWRRVDAGPRAAPLEGQAGAGRNVCGPVALAEQQPERLRVACRLCGRAAVNAPRQ